MPLSVEDIELAQIIWDYMFYKSTLSDADVIIGLGCHDLSVADDAAGLYLQNRAPLLLFSGNAGRLTRGRYTESEAQMMKSRALQLSVPEEAVLMEELSTNTGENISMSQRLLNEKGIDITSVILVHKPYMLRRDYATFMKQWQGARNVKLMCWAGDIQLTDYLARTDLDPRESVEIMIGDLERVIKYPSFGFQIEVNVPQEVKSAFSKLVAKGYTSHLLK